jgi:hypothetical protein
VSSSGCGTPAVAGRMSRLAMELRSVSVMRSAPPGRHRGPPRQRQPRLSPSGLARRPLSHRYIYQGPPDIRDTFSKDLIPVDMPATRGNALLTSWDHAPNWVKT